MIVKQAKPESTSTDPRIAAGERAERQMAFYLHRAFSTDETLFVLNDLRLVDPAQPEHTNADGACQIDHLVLHRWGAFIIESKSVSDAVSVRADGTGGDEWSRMYRGEEEGMPSPIQQAKRQGEFLRSFLQRHRETLLGKHSLLLRPLALALKGTTQRGFISMPIQLVVAISDEGRIERLRNWKSPDKPFQTFVCKADQVPDKLLGELKVHRSASNPLGEHKGMYGVWTADDDELKRVSEFLRDNHTPLAHHPKHAPPAPAPVPVAKVARPTPSRIVPQAAVCKHCGGSDLVGNPGQYGPHWKCACGKNTPMPVICHNCNAEGHRGTKVRIRKEGPKFFRCCDACGVQQLIWTNP